MNGPWLCNSYTILTSSWWPGKQKDNIEPVGRGENLVRHAWSPAVLGDLVSITNRKPNNDFLVFLNFKILNGILTLNLSISFFYKRTFIWSSKSRSINFSLNDWINAKTMNKYQNLSRVWFIWYDNSIHEC